MAAMTAALPGTRAEARIVSPPQNGASEAKGSGSNTAFAWAHRTAKASKRTKGTKAAKGRKESERKREAVDRKTAVKDHLVVLVNGVAGSPMNWTYTKAQLEAHGDPHLLVHSCESLRRTVDGVDVVGNRLADEVSQVIHRNPQLRRISFIAHSLGGVLSRYAIAQMYQPACPPASDERPSNEPASREPSSNEPASRERPSHEPSPHEPPSRESTSVPYVSNPSDSNHSGDHLHGQASQQAQSEKNCYSSSSRTPPPEEHSPDNTFPTCASTSSLPSDASSLPRHLMPKSPSVSVLDVLRRQEEQSQLADLGFPPMLRLDAEEEQQQNGERQSQGQGKEHGNPEEGGRVGERERDFAAAESEGERTRESTSRNIDGCCNVQGGEEEDVEEEEEGEEVEEEKDDEEGGGSYQGPRIAGLEPMNFVTLASPHLGSRGKGHLPFLLKVSLFEKASVPLAPLFLGRSARHLFLTDVDPPVKTTDVDPPVETTDVGPRIHPSNVNPQISTADADPRVDSTGGTEPQSETTGTNARIDTTSAGRQPSTSGVDPLSDALGAAVAGDIHVDAAKVNPSTGRVDPLNAKSGKYLPLNTNTTLSSSVDAGHPFAELSAQPAAEALAVGAESNLGHATAKEKKHQQPHGMVRLHRLGSSLIDVTRVAAAEDHSEETAETGVGSRKEKHQLPLLLRMTTDNEEGPFLSALAAFKYRAAYANVLGDQMVGWRTASIRHQWEMPLPDELHELPDYRFIVRVQPMPCQSDTPVAQPEPRAPEPRAPGCPPDTGVGGEEKGCHANTSSLHLAACDASSHASAAAAAAVAAARGDTSGAFAVEASNFVTGNATSEASGAPPGAPSGGPSGAPSGGPSGAPSGGPSDGPAAGDAPEPKEHTNFFARLKGRWKVGGGTAATPGFGLGFGFGSPQQQFLPFKQQPLKLKEKGHTEQGEEGEQAFENDKKSPDDPPEGPPEEGEKGRLQLVRSMSEGMVPRGASGRGSGSGGSSGEGSGNSRTGQGAMKNDIGHGSDEGWCGEENKARRASIGGPAAAAAAAAAGGAGGAGAAMLPRTAGIAPKKHSIQMQWEDAMVDNLNRVPWARIDVNFASSPLAFLAHILIQVNIPTLKAHGASVIQHVIDNFVV